TRACSGRCLSADIPLRITAQSLARGQTARRATFTVSSPSPADDRRSTLEPASRVPRDGRVSRVFSPGSATDEGASVGAHSGLVLVPQTTLICRPSPSEAHGTVLKRAVSPLSPEARSTLAKVRSVLQFVY